MARARKEVDALIGKFEQGRFDGMTDGYEYNSSAFNNMYGAVQYTFTSRDHSEELRAVATRLIEQQSGEKVTGESHQQILGGMGECPGGARSWPNQHDVRCLAP